MEPRWSSHARAIVERVSQVVSELYGRSKSQQGKLVSLGLELDDIYKPVRTLVLRPEVILSQSALKVVFTAIHGAGAIISVPVSGFRFQV
jgi:hypothetical protein